MRNTFTNLLTEKAKKNKKVMLIAGDLGYSVFEDFKKNFPFQYLNAGVSEQNMTGVAAGMALEGFRPVIYSIIPFVTMRNYEQIRNDICYQNLPVIIVGVGSGFSYGPYGRTHHGVEDLAIMRTLPGITVFSPADPIETRAVVSKALEMSSPVYIRLGKAGEPVINPSITNFKIGDIYQIRNGGRAAVLTTGNVVSEVIKAGDILKKIGINISIFTVPTIKPINQKNVTKIANRYQTLFTVEEHSIIGGLGSAISEILAEESLFNNFKRIGVPDKITHFVGSQEYMRSKHGLSGDKIANTIASFLKS